MRFTVTWAPTAQAKLARLWNEKIPDRERIQQAADDIDRRLKYGAEQIASLAVQNVYMIRAAPLCVIVKVSEDDRLIRVTHVFYEPDA